MNREQGAVIKGDMAAVSSAERDRCTKRADQLLARVVERHASTWRHHRLEALELYHRVARTIRVGGDPAADLREARSGAEEGVAVRLRRRGERYVRFAAVSGGVSTAAAEAMGVALGDGATRLTTRDPDLWPAVAGAVLDRDAGVLPPVRELETWLRSALDAVSGLESPLAPGAAWVEAAETVETWVSHTGLRASRSRVRAWALLAPDPLAGAEGACAPRPLTVAARAWRGLDPRAWSRELAARPTLPGTKIRTIHGRRMSVLFGPAPSASLVWALVKAVHGPEPAGPEPCNVVGPGWNVSDAPETPGAPLGGRFDDAGFPTQTVRLADGSRWLGRLEGVGTLRRASFRDPPRPLPAHVLVRPPITESVPPGLWVTDLDIHPMPLGDWVLRADGVHLDGGAPVEVPVRGAWIRTHPAELVSRCVAGWGPNRTSHRGIDTPALLFEDLAVSS